MNCWANTGKFLQNSTVCKTRYEKLKIKNIEIAAYLLW